MDQLYLAYAVVGLAAVLLVLASARIAAWPVTEPMVALGVGVVLGPHVAGVLEIADDLRTPLLLEGARGLLAVSLVAVALRFPVRALGGVVRPVGVLVTIGMPLVAASTAALVALVLGWPWALAALLGACLCPTDPILASGVVTGRRAEAALPERTRQVLTEESGANDGLALPLVAMGIAAVAGDDVGSSAVSAGVDVLLALLAVPIGYAVGRLAAFVEARGEVERTPELVLTLFLALGLLGAGRVVGADGILAVFLGGLGYNAAAPDREREQQDRLDEAFNRYLVLPLFVALGAVAPIDRWVDLGWRGAAVAAGVLLLRRPPIVVLLHRAAGLRRADAAFLGWFGPMGVSAIFYLSHAAHEGIADPRLFTVGSLAIAVSTVVHGVAEGRGRSAYRRRAPWPRPGEGGATEAQRLPR